MLPAFRDEGTPCPHSLPTGPRKPRSAGPTERSLLSTRRQPFSFRARSGSVKVQIVIISSPNGSAIPPDPQRSRHVYNAWVPPRCHIRVHGPYGLRKCPTSPQVCTRVTMNWYEHVSAGRCGGFGSRWRRTGSAASFTHPGEGWIYGSNHTGLVCHAGILPRLRGASSTGDH